jgi:hypothetical protein
MSPPTPRDPTPAPGVRAPAALPARHVRTRYARALVCARCGQDWPCMFVLVGETWRGR